MWIRRPALRIELNQQDAGKRLDHVLQSRLPQFSRARLQDWIKRGRVLVNGRGRRASLYRARRRYHRRRARRSRSAARCCRKRSRSPSFMKTPTSWPSTNPPAWSSTPAQACIRALSSMPCCTASPRFRALGGELRPGIVHRLDRYTSGVLLVAKNDAAHQRLAEQFAGAQSGEDLPRPGARQRQAGPRPHRKAHRPRSRASASA